jgi:chromosome segregation ATPase
VTESAHDMVRTSEAPERDLTQRALTQRVNDLRDQVDDLRTERDALVQRERIHELEIVAQRRELDLRFAFEATLEERLLEYQRRIDALHAHLEVEVQHRFAAELATVREHIAHAQRERDAVRGELDAERQRLSYRAVQPVALQMTKSRAVVTTLRRTARVIRKRVAPAR